MDLEGAQGSGELPDKPWRALHCRFVLQWYGVVFLMIVFLMTTTATMVEQYGGDSLGVCATNRDYLRGLLATTRKDRS